jgi:hypothetical protein
MFEHFKRKKVEVIEHWITFADGFQLSPSEFYNAIEEELQNREVPGLEKTRIDFAEGGVLSDKRIYLRMIRERLVFDVCAAPFGTRFFFSCRTAEIPIVVQIWQLLFIFLFGVFAYWAYWRFLGFIFGNILFIATIVGSIYLLRNAIALGLKDLDANLIKSPLLGSVYERWFRKETYYRTDTRLMYLDTVSNVVKDLAEEVTGAKGIKLVRQYEHAPILGGLYKPVQPRLELK